MDDDEFDELIRNNHEISNVIDNGLESDVEVKVEVPHAFPFPFPPYNIQLGFMQKLYETIELGKIGIFESPTGTGKSLSLICGSLLWLKHYEEKKRNELNKLITDKSSEKKTTTSVKSEVVEDWISEFAKKQEQEAKAQALLEEKESRKKREEKLEKMKSNMKQAKRKRNILDEQYKELFNTSKDLNITTTVETGNDLQDADVDDDVVLAEYVSDDDNDGLIKAKEDSDDGEGDDEMSKEEHVVKVYYCSRTHSQLSQFIHEVQNSPYADDIRTTSLGSRLVKKKDDDDDDDGGSGVGGSDDDEKEES